MDTFLAAQSADPFDPTSFLILADHLEEQGDATTAEALRGLASGGIPSIVAIACEAANVGVIFWADNFNLPNQSAKFRGDGHGDGFNGGSSAGGQEGRGVGEEDPFESGRDALGFGPMEGGEFIDASGEGEAEHFETISAHLG